MPPVAADGAFHDGKWLVGGVGTGALPLQKPRFPENETALLPKAGARVLKWVFLREMRGVSGSQEVV
jgi:hypothetical protein